MRWMWTVLAAGVVFLPAAASAEENKEKEKPLPPGKAAVLRLKGAMEQLKAEGKSDSEILEAVMGMLDRAMATGPGGPAAKGPPAVKGPKGGKKVFQLFAPQEKVEKPKVEKPKVKEPGAEKPVKVKALKGEKPKGKQPLAEKPPKIKPPKAEKPAKVKQPKMVRQKGAAKVKKVKGAPASVKTCPCSGKGVCSCEGKCTCKGPCTCAKAQPAKKGPRHFRMRRPGMTPRTPRGPGAFLRGQAFLRQPGPRGPWAPWMMPQGRGPAWGPRGPRAAWGQPAGPGPRQGRGFGPRGPWFAPAPGRGPGAAMTPPRPSKAVRPMAAPAAPPSAAPLAAQRIRAAAEKMRAEGKSPQEIREAVRQMKERVLEAMKSAREKPGAQ
jgi:hypothetical protein